MAKYLFRVSYTAAGLQGVLKEGGKSRAAAIEKVFASVGGKLEASYWAFGADDWVGIADVPSHAAVIALAGAVTASGAASVNTTVLITVDDVDAARALTPTYRAPGE
jgi:uncharacterized protein with GYD domain